MCFSPQADVGGGVLICAIGIDAVRHIRQRREFIALASVWCGWAAVSSAAITLHCRLARPHAQRAGSGPDGLISAG